MEDDQQFCLRWNNHQSTLIQNFDTLLESGTLVDCTLAAEGKTLKAHKVVLSACSPYFECLLSEHYDKHPVFILKDVKFKELKAMMDYMYRGEVNISQDQLAALLKAAESLQIKGLSESKTAGSNKTESRPQKTVSQPTTPSLDIPHASSGLTIEKNKVPRLSLAQSSVRDLPEDTASPPVSKGLSSREGSQSPTPRKRKRCRRRSLTEDSTNENQDASNSSDMPQQMGVPALGVTPVADEKVHADPTDSLGRSALMTQLTKPADEMLQLPLEKPEPNDSLIEPKSEYLEDAEEGVEDLTLDEDMNDLNDMEQDNNRAGPSHDPAQNPGLGSWHVTGDRSNAGGVVGCVGGGGPGTTDEVFLAAQEAAQAAHRDSQGTDLSQEESTLSAKKERSSEEKENLLKEKEKPLLKGRGKRYKTVIDFVSEPSTSTAPDINQKYSKHCEIISISDSQAEISDSDISWTNSRDVAKFKNNYKCPYCDLSCDQRHNLIRHIMTMCLLNPKSKVRMESGKLKCECGRNFGQEKGLRYHQRHECNRTVQCPDCGKIMKGSYITQRHRRNYCVNKKRNYKTKIVKKEESADELFMDDSSMDSY